MTLFTGTDSVAQEVRRARADGAKYHQGEAEWLEKQDQRQLDYITKVITAVSEEHPELQWETIFDKKLQKVVLILKVKGVLSNRSRWRIYLLHYEIPFNCIQIRSQSLAS